jgi:predicted nucleic acid-binding protein
MTLIDSSVMIDALRKRDPKLRQLFQALQPAICGIVAAEVLCGARDAAHYKKLAASLARFPQIAIPDAQWEAVGRNLWILRTKGITVPFPDVVIATVAIENDIELWTRDNQFKLIQTVLPQLKLFVEPP